MNVKLSVLTAGVLFFSGQAVFAQTDTTKNTKQIEEVVVLGYSKKSTKAKSTAASVTIDSKALENRPNVSFINSLQGNAPGISINSTSGSPGSGKINVMVRGLSSINASTDPLYVIDGLITSASQFRNLNPEDIDNISILKDAQATAIYGNRGANGVVVINTKNAKYNSGLRVTYDMLTSFSVLPKTKYNMLGAKDLLNLEHQYGVGDGGDMTQDEINAWKTDTDWNKQFFQTAMLQQHTLGITAGGKNINNYTSLGYLNTDGTFRSTDFQRFTLRNNLTGKSDNGKLTFGMQMAVGYSKRHQLDQETNDNISANIIQNPLFGSLRTPGYLEPYPFINGQDMFNQIGGAGTNYPGWVLADIVRGGIVNLFTETSILANANVNYKITDWLSVGNRTGMDFRESDRTFARNPTGYLSLAARASGAQYGGFEQMTNTKDLTFNSVSNITFDKKFGEHSLTVAAYLDYLKAHYLFKSNTQNGLDPFNWAFGAGTGYIPFNPATPSLYVPQVSAGKINAGTLAVIGTLEYDYAGKYGVSATVRRDGSYRFPKENRWETFWSVGGRWNIEKESFLEGSTAVNMLKLRGSYGTTGNQNLIQPANNGNPLFVGTNIYTDLIASNTGYMNSVGYNAVIGNPNVKWEKVSQANIGVDFGLFRNFVEGTVDVYRKKTERLFNSITLSAVTGQYTINGNNGELENKGIEASLRFNILKNQDYSVSIFANGAYNKNKILSFDGADLSDDNVNAAGGPIGQWNLYHYVGVNPATGEQQFIGKDGQVTESPSPDDKVLTGKSYVPKFTGGFGVNANYKGWFADVLFSYQAGGWMYDNVYSWLMDPSSLGTGANFAGDILNSWTPDNPNTNIPSMTANNTGLEGSSDRFLFKTDFIRLKNITFGYNFNKDLLKNLPITGIKVFVQGENLATFTKWKGYDPEPMFAYSLGVYPNPKTISVGLNVQF
ncbi:MULTISPECIES: SusC/RagA family TonB-linked outer membrane protein [unclassified Chryseobacterium]|uniref:SusC/RagA family TonB-linked outer membrane protein n=1 Tax=unclassified Chryseobacterium TaxID=2593645 RepID=UPI000E0AB289|nr:MULTISPECIES: SusC/RagA family TonB-linked outer membrane protein [unclassified Chryseobacterium]MDQ1857425.1 SusC/RagA family TonB-linked outer membrane protein [Chryseobacterium sp. WLY505]